MRLTVWITTEVSVVTDVSLGDKGALVEELTTIADEIIAAINTTRARARVLLVANFLHSFNCASISYAFSVFQIFDLAITKWILQERRNTFFVSSIKRSENVGTPFSDGLNIKEPRIGKAA